MSKYATVTIAGFATYHTERGHEPPGTWDDEKINASLLTASEWIDRVYGAAFIGQKTAGFTQANEWPRTGAAIKDPKYGYAFPSNAIPEQINAAVYEAAYRDCISPGSLLVDYTPGKYKSVSVDGAVSVDYVQFASASDMQTTFPVIDQILYWLLDSNSSAFASYSGFATRV
jgi:hypothetical protein